MWWTSVKTTAVTRALRIISLTFPISVPCYATYTWHHGLSGPTASPLWQRCGAPQERISAYSESKRCIFQHSAYVRQRKCLYTEALMDVENSFITKLQRCYACYCLWNDELSIYLELETFATLVEKKLVPPCVPKYKPEIANNSAALYICQIK